MALPSMEQYNEAAQHPRYAFVDPELQGGKIRTSGLGLPLAACGGFALTYTVTSGSHKYAVRCFHREVPDRKLRYEAITKKLANLNSAYFVNFQFQPNGIRIQGQSFPIVKMAWANGETLGEFLHGNYKNKSALTNLKKSLLELAIFLQKNSIAHGDIQPGNIMVANNGKNVQLIDYDGMYLPELSALSSAELGHVNFSHPERRSLNPWNEQADHFGFIFISLVLDALMIDPSFWTKTHSDGDKFLLGANDFIAPAKSAIFRELAVLPGMSDTVTKFADICKGPYEDIPSLPQFLNASFQIESVEEDTESVVGYISTYPVLNGKDYEACLPHVGSMVELVGKVVDVAQSHTRHGKPYVFLNFSDWRGNSVKISVWSHQINKMPGYNFQRLKGKYISVIGLLEPPYISSHFKYSHIAISLSGSINEIDAKEMTYRLAYEKDPLPKRKRASKKSGNGNRKETAREAVANSGNTNARQWQDFTNSGNAPSPLSQPQPRPVPKKSKSHNLDILAEIHNAAKTANSTPVETPRPRITTGAASAQTGPHNKANSSNMTQGAQPKPKAHPVTQSSQQQPFTQSNPLSPPEPQKDSTWSAVCIAFCIITIVLIIAYSSFH